MAPDLQANNRTQVLQYFPHLRSTDQGYTRILLKNTGTIKYLTFPSTGPASALYFDESLLAQPLPEQGDWNLAHIAQDPNNGLIHVLRTERVPLGTVGNEWHPRIVDYATLGDPEQDEHGNQPFRQDRSQIDGRAFGVAKALVIMSWLPAPSDQLSVEMEVYCWINDYGIGPQFLAHLTENNERVIGYLVEDIDGRAATSDDLPACRAVLSKLHMTGYLLGSGFTRSSFQILNSGRALITDFGSCQRCDVSDNEAFEREMVELETALRSTACWDDEAAVAAMTVEMWEHLQAIGERDGGIAEAAFNQLIQQGRITIPAETHRWMLHEERQKKGLIKDSSPAVAVGGQVKL